MTAHFARQFENAKGKRGEHWRRGRGSAFAKAMADRKATADRRGDNCFRDCFEDENDFLLRRALFLCPKNEDEKELFPFVNNELRHRFCRQALVEVWFRDVVNAG